MVSIDCHPIKSYISGKLHQNEHIIVVIIIIIIFIIVVVVTIIIVIVIVIVIVIIIIIVRSLYETQLYRKTELCLYPQKQLK